MTEKTNQNKFSRLKGSGKLLAAVCFLAISASVVWSWSKQPETDIQTLPAEKTMENIDEETYSEPETVAAEEAFSTATSYFAACRMDREESRGQELTMLKSLLADDSITDAVRQEAEQRCVELAETSAMELQAEGLLEAYGFGETVVILGEARATVMVDGDMDAQRAAQIAETVNSVSGCGFENVVVVNR